jgi:HAD superfamily hydrolase (TIGR01509 family)
MPLRAVCFDLDGLLVDTEPWYYEAHRSILAEHGVTQARDEYVRTWIIEGTRWAVEAPKHGIATDPAELTAETNRRFRALIARDLRPMPGALRVLAAAAARGPTALVTNSRRDAVEEIVDRLGMRAFLHQLVTREAYEHAKPAPDGYLAAARLMGMAPADCLALEDSPRGMKAAIAAGMPVILVLNEMTRIGGRPAGPLRILDSLEELDLEEVAAARGG